jgi:DNA primase
VIDTFRLGFADRSLGQRLPDSESLEGGAIRGCLQRVGLMRASGHEHFHGTLVVPVLNDRGDVVDLYGRFIAPKLRYGGVFHVSLFRPSRGVFNRHALSLSPEIVLCASALDALTFWCAGIRNVTATFGLRALTDSHLSAFAQSGVQRVIIAFRHDLKGDRAARWVAKQLFAIGVDCRRATFPLDWDANAVAMHRLDVRSALHDAVNRAAAFRRRQSH